MKRVFSKVAAIAAVLIVLVAALAVGIVHSVSTHAAQASAEPQQTCPSTLSLGSKGLWVQALQFELNDARSEGFLNFTPYPLPTDGVFGTSTRNAVLQLQSLEEISGGNGVVGTRTWASLVYCSISGTKSILFGYVQDTATHSPAQLSNGSTGAWVQMLQQKLDTFASDGLIGKTYGADKWFPLAVDGQFGTHTEDAVKTLEATYVLPVDGVVGHAEWSALIEAY